MKRSDFALPDASATDLAAAEATGEVKVTLAGWSSENEKVVPIGAFARLMPARRSPARHRAAD